MYKPKEKVEPQQGSNISVILNYLVSNHKNDEKLASSYVELSDLIFEKTNVRIDRRIISNAILRFNEGLYSVNGVDVETYGMIDVLDRSTTTPDKTPSNTGSDVDMAEIQKRVKGGKISGGYVKIDGKTYYVRAEHDESELAKAEQEIKEQLAQEFWDTNKYVHSCSEGKEGVVFVADIHIGALVQDLIKTPNFNTEVVKEKLLKAVDYVNNMGFDKVHVMILGDLIESYTGLNHKNTWKGLEIGAHGPEVIKLATKIIDEFFLSKIENLAKVNMIAGNHCRTFQSTEEETQGGASNLVAWALQLKGYDVNFHPVTLTVEVEGIVYILLHGDKGISKRPTKEIIWDFGKQGKYNFVAEGHLHSRIQKASAKQAEGVKTIMDDSLDCRRQTMPSIFTGNDYSENNEWFSLSGFVVVTSNGEGKPIVVDYPL